MKDEHRPRAAQERVGMMSLRAGHVCYASPCMASHIGYTRDELIGRALSDLTETVDGGPLDPARLTRDATTLRFLHKDDYAVVARVQTIVCADQVVLTAEFDTFGKTDRTVVERYRDIYENVAEGIYRSSLDGVQLNANPALVRLNGYETEPEMLAAVNDIAAEWYVLPERRSEFQNLLTRDGEVHDFVSQIYRHKTREKIWISENARIVRDPSNGQPIYYEGTIRVVTNTIERMQEKERHAKITAQAPGCLFQTHIGHDGQPTFSFLSEGIRQMCGLSPQDVLADATVWGRRIHPKDRGMVSREIMKCAAEKRSWSSEFRLRRADDGRDIWIGGTATPEWQADGELIWTGFLTDVTERRNTQEQVRRLAYSDQLTGLANRAALVERAPGIIRRAISAGRSGALFFLDLDNFKTINDVYGHDTGDTLLTKIAQRLGQIAGRGSLIARLGGDEFVILASHFQAGRAAEQADALAVEIHEAVSVPFTCEGAEHLPTPSIGLEIFDGAEVDLSELLKRSDVAMYSVKTAGRDGWARFDRSMQDELEASAALQADTRTALLAEEFELYVQPLVCARSGDFLGGEALLRWFHPERGAVPPDVFVQVCEDTGLWLELQIYVLREACAILNRWATTPGFETATLAVNISPTFLQDEHFVLHMLKVMRETGVPADRLVLEITEHGVLADMADVAEKMELLRAYGLRFALDDFGTGYSSLTYLKRLPLDDVKIDRSFIANLQDDAGDRAIVEAILTVASQLGLAVTAEGVETLAHATYLNEKGCRKLQGYLFSPAIAQDELTGWVQARAAAMRAPAKTAEPLKLRW